MPQYSYKCHTCTHTFDKQQGMTEEPLKDCPACKGEIYRVIGKNIGIQFVGSGFYINEASKSESPKNQSSSSKEKKSTS